MSTKIYNGFKIDTNDICEVQNILMAHHTEVKEITENKTIEFLIKSAVNGLDKDTIHKKDTNKNYLSEAGSDLLDRQREVRKTQERDPQIDFGAEIVVIPFEGKFYGIYYTEHDEFLKKLLDHPKVSEYGYWDNTDRPDEVSARDWKKREKIWDGIFEGKEVPCEIGFSKKFNSYVPYPKIETIVEKWEQFCPTFESRIKYWTVETYTSREMERRKSEIAETNPGDVSQIMSLFFEINGDKSEEAQKKRNIIKRELKNTLIKELNPTNIGIDVEKIQNKKPKMR
jgi:hypothetical protein